MAKVEASLAAYPAIGPRAAGGAGVKALSGRASPPPWRYAARAEHCAPSLVDHLRGYAVDEARAIHREG